MERSDQPAPPQGATTRLRRLADSVTAAQAAADRNPAENASALEGTESCWRRATSEDADLA